MRHQRVGWELSAAIAALGCTSLVTQTILLREFMSIFAGNELVIGMVLANWMILTGTGAILGRLLDRTGVNPGVTVSLLLLTGTLPIVTVFLVRSLRNLVFPAGAVIGMWESAYSSFILLIPYCLVSGCLFTMMARMISDRQEENKIAWVYSVEAIGSIAGGLAFNLVAVAFFTTFQSLIFVAMLDLAVCATLAKQSGGRPAMSGILAFGAVILIVSLTVNLDQVTRERMFDGQSLLYHTDTPYGSLVVTKQGDQTNFFENSALLFSSGDVTTNEEAVHYAMVQHPSPAAVLIISGGMSGIAEEVCKYDVTVIDDVEINPWIIEAGRRFTSAVQDRRIHVINEDARRYLRHCSQKYDVVLLNVPDPGTAEINRYYTTEFFRELKPHLAEGGVLSLSLLSAADYFGSDARLVTSSIRNTLKSGFRNVLVIPGNRTFLVASDNDLSINVTQLIDRRGIPTTYVNRNYIDDQLLSQRSAEITKTLDPDVDVNRDFYPVAYYRQMQYWLSYFSFNPWIPAAIAGAILVVVLFKLNAVTFGMLTGGLTASSVEVLLLVSFQMIYGYVYQATGVIITVFMAGLAAGSWYDHGRRIQVRMARYAFIQGLMGIFCVLLPVCLTLVKENGSDGIVYAAFTLLTFIMGFMVGIEFSMATKLLKGSVSAVASGLYSVDLLGSAIGALTISVYLLPQLGIVLACIVIGSASLLSASVSFIRRGKWIITSAEGASYV